MERLDKLLSSRTYLTRKEIKEAVKAGQIEVNGCIVKDSSLKLYEEDIVCLNGKQLYLPKHIYIMMNKPKGVVSATTDPKEKTVIDLIDREYQRPGLFPAGRLDKDTEGFLLITDDGEFAHRILSPKNHITKTYEAILEHTLKENDIALLESGLTLEDGTRLQKAKVRVLRDDKQPLVEIIICEGKYHQVKRMFSAVGNQVLSLKRTKMGSLALDESLKSGISRVLSIEETQNIENGNSFSDFD